MNIVIELISVFGVSESLCDELKKLYIILYYCTVGNLFLKRWSRRFIETSQSQKTIHSNNTKQKRELRYRQELN